ncbi:MAG TPA: alkaline phosphatase family protein [Gemmatimonadaceae bacterium]|nr:alkaline phosphatase family protein [Gemmatimonadaceae bacterium]
MRRILVLSSVALAASACAPLRSAPEHSVVQQSAPRPSRGRVTDHVIVISVDGLRPDAIARFEAKTIQRMMNEGRYSLTAQTIPNSNTLPSHTSMLTGVDAEDHGITWNSDKTGQFGYVKVPTVFGVAHDAGYTTAAFFSKPKFHHIGEPTTLDHMRAPNGGPIPWNSGKTLDLVREYLADNVPNLMFVHIADADFAGHNFGWMGWMYGMAVRQADAAVAQVIQMADKRFGRGAYTVVLTSDHGGHGRRHGSTDPLDTTIPWIVWGAGVHRGETLSGVRTMDTAATTLWMLGLTAPAGFDGHAISAAFEPRLASER